MENKARAFQATVQSAGWWCPGNKVCFISDRPEWLCIERDARGVNRLHSEDGPSARWRDGFSLWHIGGVAVDEKIVIRPQEQSIREIKSEQNVEVKRIRIERFGWPRYLKEMGAKVRDYRRNDIDQTDESLMAVDGMSVLVCACRSTARVYALEVPAEVQTAEQAQVWLRGEKKFRVIGAS
jgi:hypothetical protein